ncbi:MAG: hypothetical protein OEM67_11000 [Thermoleophilia bacterium]|nr:hypothetical protein [Thermoleophilia bacterium]MDH3724560.1 hypothetical protein [Thermoleophilia bacterium]
MSVRERLEDAARDDARLARMPGPAAVMIFGATGDLRLRKLAPALYSLATRRLAEPSAGELELCQRDRPFEAAVRAAELVA